MLSPELQTQDSFVVIDDVDPAKAWVIPVKSDEQRIAPGLALQVFKTGDFGQSWTSDSDGLPDQNSFDILLRHAFMRKGDLFIFGTTNGHVYYRHGHGKWLSLDASLVKVNAIYV